MPRKKLTDSDTTARLAHLGKTLHLCRRDDSAVVKALYKDRVVDNVEVLDKVTFFDELFTFLKMLKVWELLESLDPGHRVRASISWAAMVRVYIMRIVVGVPSILQTEGLILTDAALMTLFGLAAFVGNGVTRRGLSRAYVLPQVRGAHQDRGNHARLPCGDLWQEAIVGHYSYIFRAILSSWCQRTQPAFLRSAHASSVH